MSEEKINFETAKLAREKGFNWSSDFYYNEKKEIYGTKMGMHGNPNAYGFYSAPSQSVLQKWIREKHGLYIWLKPSNDVLDRWSVYIDDGLGHHYLTDYLYVDGYEAALEDGLQESLKLIKTNN